jgi:hypothetical protein
VAASCWGVLLLSVAAILVPTPAPAAGTAVPPGQDHACIVGSPPAHGIDWAALRNPILSSPTHGFKDQALQWAGGQWHMLYTYMSATSAAPHVLWDVASSTSSDLAQWTPPHVIATNAASPDIVRDRTGHFIVTYQTQVANSQLEYRVSSGPSLRTWSAAHPLGHGLATRMIDGALAFTGNGVILGFKAGTTTQHFEIAWSPSLSGTFHLIGQPDITVYNDTVENYEFLTVHGAWTLVATSNLLDQPYLFTLGPGDPATPATWLRWSAGSQLMVPNQPFNSGPGLNSVGYEHANSAFLCVGPRGEDYLTYAASTELTDFGGWGHARIGIARSDDLTNWQVPPE